MYKLIEKYFISSALPSNISINWNYGSLLGISLVIQIITGITLGMHYNANINLSYNLIEYILRDINNGWILRYLHSNGASIIFILLYLHIGRAIYMSSYTYPRIKLWNIGIIIYILIMGIAFLGYVLPFGIFLICQKGR